MSYNYHEHNDIDNGMSYNRSSSNNQINNMMGQDFPAPVYNSNHGEHRPDNYFENRHPNLGKNSYHNNNNNNSSNNRNSDPYAREYNMVKSAPSTPPRMDRFTINNGNNNNNIIQPSSTRYVPPSPTHSLRQSFQNHYPLQNGQRERSNSATLLGSPVRSTFDFLNNDGAFESEAKKILHFIKNDILNYVSTTTTTKDSSSKSRYDVKTMLQLTKIMSLSEIKSFSEALKFRSSKLPIHPDPAGETPLISLIREVEMTVGVQLRALVAFIEEQDKKHTPAFGGMNANTSSSVLTHPQNIHPLSLSNHSNKNNNIQSRDFTNNIVWDGYAPSDRSLQQNYNHRPRTAPQLPSPRRAFPPTHPSASVSHDMRPRRKYNTHDDDDDVYSINFPIRPNSQPTHNHYNYRTKHQDAQSVNLPSNHNKSQQYHSSGDTVSSIGDFTRGYNEDYRSSHQRVTEKQLPTSREDDEEYDSQLTPSKFRQTPSKHTPHVSNTTTTTLHPVDDLNTTTITNNKTSSQVLNHNTANGFPTTNTADRFPTPSTANTTTSNPSLLYPSTKTNTNPAPAASGPGTTTTTISKPLNDNFRQGHSVHKDIVQVLAPETLPEYYSFDVRIGDEIFVAMVPPGGVKKGEIFNSYMTSLDPQGGIMSNAPIRRYYDMNIPQYRWRDGIGNICAHGLCHPILLNSFFVPPIALVQIMSRMKLDIFGNKVDSLSRRIHMGDLVFIFFTLLLIHIFLGLMITRGILEQQKLSFYLYSSSPVLAIDILLFIYFQILVMKTRKAIRKYSKIPMCCSGEDVLAPLYCTPCALSQMARHTADYETYNATCCTATGLPDHMEVMLEDDTWKYEGVAKAV